MRGGRAGLLQPWELAYVGQYESYNIVIHIFCYYTAICVLRIYIAYYVGVVLLVLEYAKNTSITIHKPYSASVYRRRHTSLYVVILSTNPLGTAFPEGYQDPTDPNVGEPEEGFHDFQCRPLWPNLQTERTTVIIYSYT